MRKTLLFFLVIIISSLSFCTKEKWKGKIYKEGGVTILENKGSGLWGGKTDEKITFTEDLSIGEEEGEEFLMFHSFLRVAVDFELNIYVLDVLNHRLLKFDKEGNFIWKTGRKGQGPGEFQWPGSIALTPSEEIAIADSPFIHLFSKDGVFQKTLKLRESIRNVQFQPDGRLFINIMLRGQPGIAAEYYSLEGKLLEKFPYEYRYGPKMSPSLGASIGGGYFQLIDDKVYLSLPDKYEIREYDSKGNLLRKIIRDIIIKPPNIKVRFGGRGVSVYPSDSSGPCFKFQRKTLINELQSVEKVNEDKYESKKFLDFFNEKGQFLGTYSLENNATLNIIDHQNNLYFVLYDPFPRIIRSKLKL
jgi:hypothetical protein